EFDDSTGLNYLNARYYNSKSGQFISQDPAFLDIGASTFEKRYNIKLEHHLANPQALNSYSYALNNPVKYEDSEGEIAFIPFLVMAAIVALEAYDTYDTVKTVADPNVSLPSKALAVALFASPVGEAKATGKIINNTLVKYGDELVPVFRGGDLFFDKTQFKNTLKGNVIDPSLSKNLEGLSVNINPNNKHVLQHGGPKQILSLPKGLRMVQSGKDPGHFVITPSYKMSTKKFESLINKMNDRIKKIKSR
ncbi:MAG: hypothetical protein QG585_499, partial [Patescibacteria group bacterium]|nr:hypothetical protein [Patescibacteria group bacterium]